MPARCPVCSRSDFRLAKFHSFDITKLLTFLYPVRCQYCRHRGYTLVPLALLYLGNRPGDDED